MQIEPAGIVAVSTKVGSGTAACNVVTGSAAARQAAARGFNQWVKRAPRKENAEGLS